MNDLKLDIHLIRKEKKSNFRWLMFGIGASLLILGGGMIGLAAMLACGFGWIG